MPISSCNLLDHVQSETHARQISVISRKIHRLSLSVDELKDFFRQAPATFHIPCEYLALICFQGGLGRGNTDEKYLQQTTKKKSVSGLLFDSDHFSPDYCLTSTRKEIIVRNLMKSNRRFLVLHISIRYGRIILFLLRRNQRKTLGQQEHIDRIDSVDKTKYHINKNMINLRFHR